MNSKTSSSTILGARASNAGDVFHELWALRAALKLLVPGTELKAVTVEGVAAPVDSGFQYDGADCALFYGNASLERATKINIIQLKYSTADPLKAWTVARLTSNDAKKGNNSVLRKLADTFKEVHGKMAANSTLVIQFVSNQPLSDSVNDVITLIQSGDVSTPDATKIVKATGLTGATLAAFLNALDFSEMGSGSRMALEDAIIREVSEMAADQSDQRVITLQGEVRQLMLPGAEREKIIQARVLSWFGISTLSGLFPAPADLQPVNDLIERLPAKEISDAINKGTRLICLHGLGGCGKTTTMRQAQSLLPKNSVTVLFDCYGAGRYKDSNDRRHLPERAFLQIVNNLAQAQGLPLLLAKSSSNPADIRIFLERLKQSAEILSKVNPEGILAIFIDAADNSVSAAEESSSECFVWEIAQADLSALPANVRIIMSSRTGRKARLRLPLGAPEVLCPPFTREETSAYAHKKLSKVSDDWIDQFQMLSSGIARVQSYAFTKGGTSKNNILEALRPSGKKLDEVLRELFKDASKKAGDVDFYNKCIAAIVALPAPIPLVHLAGVCQVAVEVVTDFISDVYPTLRIEENAVTIADEDVEDFLTNEAQTLLPQAYSSACVYFKPIYRTDSYAAIHYADLLRSNGLAADILPLIERDLTPAGIADPVVRREVQLRRLRLALCACQSTKSSTDTMKVILLSAEAAKGEAALTELLEREAELSVRFASGSLLRLILSDRDQYPKQGSILVNDASRAALSGDMVTARERLNAYDNWEKRRLLVSDNERHDWVYSYDDVVTYAEARTIVQGPERFIPDLRQWNLEWQPKVAVRLVPRLIKRGRRDLIEKAYTSNLVERPWNLLLAVPLALCGFSIKIEKLKEDLSALKRRYVPDIRSFYSNSEDNWKLDYLEVIITACEIAFTKHIASDVISKALGLILDHRRSPSNSIYHHNVAQIDIALRAWLLQKKLTGNEAKSEDFLAFLDDANPVREKKKPGRKKKVKAKNNNRSDNEAKRVVEAIFPIYESRIEVLTEAAQGKISGKPKSDISEIGRDAYYFDREHYGGQFRTRAGQSVARLMHIDGLSIEYLYERAEIITRTNSDSPFATRSLPIWKEFLVRPSLHQKILDGISSRAIELRSVRTGSKAKSDTLLDFSKIVLNFSRDDSAALFEKAVEITEEIDHEAMVQIEFVAGLATRHEDIPITQRRLLGVAHAAFVTDVAIRLEGEERFPWKSAVSAIYDFSPEVALAAISQWQDEGIIDLDETLPTVLRKLATFKEKVPLACALIGLLKYVSDDFSKAGYLNT